jgi:hypothetical protein
MTETTKKKMNPMRYGIGREREGRRRERELKM